MHVFVLNAGASPRPGLDGAELKIADPDAFLSTRGVNTGELLEYDNLLRHLKATRVTQMAFARAGHEQAWPREQPDVTVIRGSNYLLEGLDLGHALPLLRHLQGPVVAVGIGAQAASFRRLNLPEGSVAFWREVGSRATSLGVRGAYSAEVLEAIGVRNLRVIGCPGLYRSCQPELSLRPFRPRAARIGLTLNRMLHGPYTASPQLTLLAQQRILSAAARRPASRLYAQGEREEMLLLHGRAQGREAALSAILRAYGLEKDAEVAAFLQEGLVAHLDPAAWAEDLARHVDAVVGVRLQGNMLALQQGIPVVPLVHDTRTREIAELLALPAVEAQIAGTVEFDYLLEGAEFSGVAAAYSRGFKAYRDFLDENGLVHRLGGPALPESAAFSPSRPAPATLGIPRAATPLRSDAPIFVVGTGRCGSTYVQTALSRTQDIWVWGEHAGLLRGLLRWAQDTRADPNLNRFVYPFAAQDPEARLHGRAFLPDWDLSWLNSLGIEDVAHVEREAVLSLFAHKLPAGKRRWGFKEIRYTADDGVLERLMELFPRARVVHLLRHPEDTVESSLLSWGRNATVKALAADDLSAVTAQYRRVMNGWVQATERLLALARQFPQVRSFRIEDGDAMLEALARFLDIDVHALRAAAEASGGARNPRQPIPQDAAQERLIASARLACADIAAPLAAKLGYRLGLAEDDMRRFAPH